MYDLVIIGAGPIGLYAAFNAGMRNINACVIESTDKIGGQLNLYPNKIIYDIPGMLEITASDLKEKLYKQYLQFENKVPIFFSRRVEEIINNDDHIKLIISGEKILTKTVLLTSGKGNFKPRKLEIENADLAKNILYKLENPNLFKDKKVIVLGGGDTAVDWANMLMGVSKNITLIHRRNEFRAHESSVLKLRSHANILTPYNVDKIELIDNSVKKITVSSNILDNIKVIDVDYILVAYGIYENADIFAQTLDTETSGILVKTNMQTSNDKIYACGDAVFYIGKAKNLSSGFGEVSTSLNAISQYLYPSKTSTFYSSINYKK